MAAQLAKDLLRGPGTTSPGPEQLGLRPDQRPGAARGPPIQGEARRQKAPGIVCAASIMEGYLSEHEAAPQLRQKLRTLRLWRQRGTGPAWIKVGKLVFYSRSALLTWLASLEHQPVRSRNSAKSVETIA
jgi:hypothetical protein